MGNLIEIMLDDAFDQRQLFQRGILASGCSMKELARLACTSPLALAWTRRHLFLGGQEAIKSLLEQLPCTSECRPSAKLGIARPGARTHLDFEATGGPVLWTNIRNVQRIDFADAGGFVALHELTSWMDAFLSHLAKVRPLVESHPVKTGNYNMIFLSGRALFRSFDDIVRVAFPRPSVSICDKEEMERMKKRQRC